MKPHYQQSETQLQDERRDSDHVLSLLQKRLDTMILTEQQVLESQTTQCVEGAFNYLLKKLKKKADLVLRSDVTTLVLRWGYHSTADAFSSSNGRIEWGRAYPETKSISLLTVVSLAPKEILRQVATHEALHIVYSLLVPSCLTESKIDFSVSEYPIELQQEEQWVRNMMKNLGFNESYLEFWEVAVEEAGSDWKHLYYKLKKNPPNLE